jgi:GTP-binding protein
MKMGETDSADKFMVLVVEYFYLFLLKWEEREFMNYKLVNHKLLSKEIDGKKMWPIEELTIDLPENLSGRAVEFVTIRKGEMLSMEGKGSVWL